MVKALYGERIFAYGLKKSDEPIGFVAVSRNYFHNCPCLFIKTSERNRGYSKALLNLALKKSAEENIKKFYINYYEDYPWSDAALNLLSALGFDESGYRVQNCFFKMEEIRKILKKIEERYARFLTYEAGVMIRPLSALNEAEIKEIQNIKVEHIPFDANPLQFDLDQFNTWFAFKERIPVGWLLSEAYTKKSLYIHQFYIHPSHRLSGLVFPVLYRAISGVCDGITVCSFIIESDNTKMQGFSRLFKDCEMKKNRMIEMVKDIS